MSELDTFESAIPRLRGLPEAELRKAVLLCRSAIDFAFEEIRDICNTSGHAWDNEDGKRVCIREGESWEETVGYNYNGSAETRMESSPDVYGMRRNCSRCGKRETRVEYEETSRALKLSDWK